MRCILAVLFITLTTPSLLVANDKIDRLAPTDSAIFNPGDMQWIPDPSLPEGSQIALVAGNPGAAEVFMVYVKLPPGTIIPPHTHPYAEVVTVLKGSIGNGHGDTFDKNQGKILEAGSIFILPAGHPHYLWNDEEVIALLTATGPWNIEYVNPADDPRNK